MDVLFAIPGVVPSFPIASRVGCEVVYMGSRKGSRSACSLVVEPRPEAESKSLLVVFRVDIDCRKHVTSLLVLVEAREREPCDAEVGQDWQVVQHGEFALPGRERADSLAVLVQQERQCCAQDTQAADIEDLLVEHELVDATLVLRFELLRGALISLVVGDDLLEPDSLDLHDYDDSGCFYFSTCSDRKHSAPLSFILSPISSVQYRLSLVFNIASLVFNIASLVFNIAYL